MATAFDQARAAAIAPTQPAVLADAAWPWLLALLHHDSLASFEAYRTVVASLQQRHAGAGLQRKLLDVASSTNLATLARQAAPLCGLHAALRRGDIAIHTDNPLTRDFLPPLAARVTLAAKMFFEFRQAGAHTPSAAARIASYLILLTLHPYRDGNGRTARLLFAADTAAAAAPATDLLGLVWLHGQRGARFHLAAKCARAGDFGMLFVLYAESVEQGTQRLHVPLAALGAALSAADDGALIAAAQVLHAMVAMHVRQG